ncbi:MFS general substrate transporter [Saccharata proteae CBS 121410]|uniref:MFS general substrate transporter n=1 Tax=Saccharata proteae CBS 121410 TaxID=1314787 RepID=A0A9P4I205_9PEZI|nr:MFS general substrate transporter [Saccharata proteae CBS 121410]
MDLPAAGDALQVAAADSAAAAAVPLDKPAPTDEKSGATLDSAEKAGGGHPNDAPADKPPFSNLRLVALVLTVAGAAFLNTLGVQSAVIILPTIGNDLDIPSSRQQWIVSAYSLTFGCFLLLWGRLADVYGKKVIFIFGSAWLTVVTLVLPFVRDEIGFDVLRGLQGLGAAANVPTAIGILGVTFPPGKHKNYAFSCYGAGAPLGSVFGNILGGLIGEYLTWRWVFWVMAIMAAVVTTAGYFVIPAPPIATAPPASVKSAVDWFGGMLITVGLMVLLFALTEGNVVGWSTPWVPVLIVVAVILIALFVVWQRYLETRTARRPLVKVSIFSNLRFSAAMAIMALFFAAFSNFLIYATYFYQDFQGLSIIQTMLRFIPTGVVGICVAFTTAHLLSRVPGNLMIMFGTFCVSISCLLFAVPIPTDTTYWAFGFPAMCLAVFGADTVYPSLTLFTAHSLPQEDQALGGAIVNAVGQIGRAIGLAIATAIETAVIANRKGLSVGEVGNMDIESGDVALRDGLRAAEWLSWAFAICAVFIAGLAMRGVGKLGRKH